MKATILIVSLAALLGCKSVAADREASRPVRMSRFERDMRGIFKSSVRWNIAKELRGAEPTAGHTNWREYWIWRAWLVRKKHDADQHVAYIVEQRRAAGLPDIPELTR